MDDFGRLRCPSRADREEMADAAPSIREQDRDDGSMLVFAVSSVNEVADRLREADVKLAIDLTDRDDWMIRTAHFRDPEGNLIEINEPLGADVRG